MVKEADPTFPETKVHHNQLILDEAGLPPEATNNSDPTPKEDNFQQLRQLANMTIKPNWNISVASGYAESNNDSTVSQYRSAQSSPSTSTIDFSGFSQINVPQAIEIRRSVRPKKLVDRYCPQW